MSADNLDPLFANNRAWSAGRTAADPGFFERLAKPGLADNWLRRLGGSVRDGNSWRENHDASLRSLG